MADPYAGGIFLSVVIWAVAVGISMLIMFWVVRAAILSALAEDRRRVAHERRFLEKEARKAAKKAAKKAPSSDQLRDT